MEILVKIMKNVTRQVFLLASLLVLIVLPGCGGDGAPPRYPVSGKVTYQGQPVPEGIVNFIKVGGGAEAATLTADGTFDFKPIEGLPAGDYQVFIIPPETMNTPPTPDRPNTPVKEFPNIPKKYRLAASSELTATVAAKDENKLTFDMK